MELGNLDARRDWGNAKEYVQGMWKMLQVDEPDTFILATNKTETIRHFVRLAFAAVDIEINWTGKNKDEKGICTQTGKTVVSINPKFYRPVEAEQLIGNPAKAAKILGWVPSTSIEDLCQMMVLTDLKRNERGFSF
jgi:GDPmannose 4,6-dehydratase